jgi:hypothetical protein
MGLPTEWFEDRDGFPALAGQKIWGVEHVVSWVMDTDVEVHLWQHCWCSRTLLKRATFADVAFKASLLKTWLCFVEGPLKGRLGSVIELVGDEGLEVVRR